MWTCIVILTFMHGGWCLPPGPRSPSGQPSSSGTAAAASAVPPVVASPVGVASESARGTSARDRPGVSPWLGREVRGVVEPVPPVTGSVTGSVSGTRAVAAAGVRHIVTSSPGGWPGKVDVPVGARLLHTGPVHGCRAGSGSGLLAPLPLPGIRVRFRFGCNDCLDEIQSHLRIHVAGRVHWVQGPACSERLLNFLPAAAGAADQFDAIQHSRRLKFFLELEFQFR